MDADLYDEFGNYIGPNIASDEEEIEDDSGGEDDGGDEETPEQAIDHIEKPDESLASAMLVLDSMFCNKFLR
ncbi:unnamed protein product [Dibothriocephalus latus]|uniref:116kDa U5 small nuclear ribonucleoprotein component N-terminal domain-containing protein n=1 Tax=Dibothriocephalus latus TaxID=60516 RepID=A0A3P7LIH3_DIBLA|nr:unnamed protein product [Dibothriocephalus latus]